MKTLITIIVAMAFAITLPTIGHALSDLEEKVIEFEVDVVRFNR